MTFEEASEKIWVDYSPYTEGWGDVSFAESHGYTEYTRSDIAKADWYMRAEIKRLEEEILTLNRLVDKLYIDIAEGWIV